MKRIKEYRILRAKSYEALEAMVAEAIEVSAYHPFGSPSMTPTLEVIQAIVKYKFL